MKYVRLVCKVIALIICFLLLGIIILCIMIIKFIDKGFYYGFINGAYEDMKQQIDEYNNKK